MKKDKKWNDAFDTGYYAACAMYLRAYGTEIETKYLILANLKTIEELKELGVDELDLEVLEPLLKTIKPPRKETSRG